MTVMEMLQARKADLTAKLAGIKHELEQVNAAMEAILKVAPSAESQFAGAAAHAMSVDDAIVKAVEAGNNAPMSILRYLALELGVHTTINSIRTRVSRLGQTGRIARNDHGWVGVA